MGFIYKDTEEISSATSFPVKNIYISYKKQLLQFLLKKSVFNFCIGLTYV